MGYPLNLVLIDDDRDDHEIFAMALTAIGGGITCKYYEDARIAMTTLLHQKDQLPDFIFLDLNMPALNGKDCLRTLKHTAHLAHIPAILYSTSIMPSDEQVIMALGAHCVFTKPHSQGKLIATLQQIFEGKEIEKSVGL
jgi:CheY-like chemotaxis protein